ncbi:glycine--tRNA ligase subunit beta [Sulfurirhabdus autotrophica]|uniref:Glycine--tRNA ligase beta subunit n=1 Tax=Sulfurirhabdus autotrophica TaxID=1706046 RepID=A0A4R3XZA6_9PROT|nr:glycine--tRNA ligase subunit beta [Sulfurirhabdus autotrophica]TCV84706.1 glycyl-tRNA synthetase beta chain [Sulfurirhabdus autotrophica]
MSDTLLIELLTEELPPKSLQNLSQVFAQTVSEGLREEGFLAPDSVVTAYATPRRLAVAVSKVAGKAPDQEVVFKGPSVKAGLDAEGNPTQALMGFAKKQGVAIDALERIQDGKNEAFAYRGMVTGNLLAASLEGKVQAALKKLPVAKMMHWGDSDIEFVRPVHGLIMLHGNEVVPGDVLGLKSGRLTRGHRFLGEGEITLQNAAEYESTLATRGKVIADFEQRKALIREKLQAQAGEGHVVWDEALLNEVTALVEFPVVYAGEFSQDFLSVPQECLIISMKQHQKYFPLVDAKGTLLPRFLVVSNLETPDPQHIIHGNERVLRARLSDAKFFYDQDRKIRLEDRVPKLENVVYHNKLGSQLDRVHRLRKLAGEIARKLGAQAEHAERAAYLCKGDLLADMVGEFPELQGLMGQYYARNDGEPEVVAQSIEAHYHPRFAGDSLPQENIGACVALADKLDTLVGIYGVGLIPTGDKDPFGLRRHALGVLRILAEMALPLDLLDLLQLAKSQFAGEVLADSVATDVHGFMLERLKHYLRELAKNDAQSEEAFTVDEIESVVSQRPTRIDLIMPRLKAVQAFRKLPESESLAAANKRIQNILKKTEVPSGEVDIALLQESAERALFEAVNRVKPAVSSCMQNRDYTDALSVLAGVRSEVDTFFNEVMVMADEPLIRNNRLTLLNELGTLMNQVADISKLAG